jgi:Flp pilus assembly protein TadG
MIVAALLPAMALTGIGEAILYRTGAQEAADAAALAAAQQATVTEQVDALGNVYGYSVSIDLQRAETAASEEWRQDAGLLLGASPTLFKVAVDNNQPAGAPATANVVAEIAYSDFLLGLAGQPKQQILTVQATAGTCGGKTWPGEAPPWCQQ